MSAILCCGEVWLSVTVLRKDANGPLGSLECSGPAGSAGCSAIVKSSKWLTCAVLSDVFEIWLDLAAAGRRDVVLAAR